MTQQSSSTDQDDTASEVDVDVEVVVIGMGPGGEVAASRLLAAGLRVAVVEEELIGGECAYWACIPSKTVLRPPKARTSVERAAGSTVPPWIGQPHASTATTWHATSTTAARSTATGTGRHRVEGPRGDHRAGPGPGRRPADPGPPRGRRHRL